ncbi:MAG: hypothetical protein HYT80_04810 [Euryarchaeota archaeon]|nr:hypothetical protein [Euryarchaeota archaeon]
MRCAWLAVLLLPVACTPSSEASDADCARFEFGPSPYLAGPIPAGATVRIPAVYEVDWGCPGVPEACPAPSPPVMRYEVHNPDPNLVVTFDTKVPQQHSNEYALGTNVRPTNMSVFVREDAPAFSPLAIDATAWECGQARARNATQVRADFRSNLTVTTVFVDGGRDWAAWSLLATSRSNGPLSFDIDVGPARERDPGSKWAFPGTQRLPADPPDNRIGFEIRGANLSFAEGYRVVFWSHYDGPQAPDRANATHFLLGSFIVPRGGIRFEGEATTPAVGWVGWAVAVLLAARRTT